MTCTHSTSVSLNSSDLTMTHTTCDSEQPNMSSKEDIGTLYRTLYQTWFWTMNDFTYDEDSKTMQLTWNDETANYEITSIPAGGIVMHLSRHGSATQ